MRQLPRLSTFFALAVATVFVSACADSAPTDVFASAPLMSKASAKTVERPLTGSCTTELQSSSVDQTGLTLNMTGVCNMSHLGRTTIVIHQICSFIDGSCQNSGTHTAANGDLLYGTWYSAPGQNQFDGFSAVFAGTSTFTGGTGRFVGATGTAFASGTAKTDPVTGILSGEYTFNGTISY